MAMTTFAARRAIRLVPQDVALYPFMTARENCIAFAKSGGASWGEAGNSPIARWN